jgi:hypothetical protein
MLDNKRLHGAGKALVPEAAEEAATGHEASPCHPWIVGVRPSEAANRLKVAVPVHHKPAALSEIGVG